MMGSVRAVFYSKTWFLHHFKKRNLLGQKEYSAAARAVPRDLEISRIKEYFTTRYMYKERNILKQHEIIELFMIKLKLL